MSTEPTTCATPAGRPNFMVKVDTVLHTPNGRYYAIARPTGEAPTLYEVPAELFEGNVVQPPHVLDGDKCAFDHAGDVWTLRLDQPTPRFEAC